MKIIIKKDLLTNSEEVINILYGINDNYIESWINAYFNQEIECLKMAPITEGIRHNSVDYFVEIEDNVYYLVKKYKQVLKGYIYNTSEKISEKILSIRFLDYDNVDTLLTQVQNQPLWNGINNEINNRVMKRLDQDSLCRINMNFEAAIKTKPTWTSTELVMLQHEITKNYKKDLYSSIVKKMKRVEKKRSSNAINSAMQQPINFIQCKTITIDEKGISGSGGLIPDLSKFSGTSCSLEYQIVQKKEKYE